LEGFRWCPQSTDPEPVAFFRPHFRGWVAPR
jgi:hypothetical protein